jgi:hypothetical protein
LYVIGPEGKLHGAAAVLHNAIKLVGAIEFEDRPSKKRVHTKPNIVIELIKGILLPGRHVSRLEAPVRIRKKPTRSAVSRDMTEAIDWE